MKISSRLQVLAGVLPRAGMRRHARQFVASTADCRNVQQDVLRRLVALNRDSRFARKHGLDHVENPRDLQRLPIFDFDDYHPWIERLKAGEHSALLGPNNPLLMFTLSSGTTANSKFIPVTQQFLVDYRRGWKIWAIYAYDDHPQANAQKIFNFCGNHRQFTTDGGTPCGNISGLAVAMQPRVVHYMYSVPFEVARIEDPDAKYYTALRFAVADDVGSITTANPSTLLHLAQLSDRYQDSLIRDVSDGTISQDFEIESEIRQVLMRRLSRKRRRARQLEQIAERTGRLRPRDMWPQMRMLAIWTGGSCASYLDSVREAFGDVPTRDHGLSASEGRMTIPMEDNTPDGVLDISAHYYEFVPVEEYETKHPTVLEAHELEIGRDYYILLTTSSGFYRYDICDVVRCTGHCGTTPMLRFLHKGAHIANITGEKLSESQIVESVRESSVRLRLGIDTFTAMPAWGQPPGYRLAIEQADLTSPQAGSRLAERVDERLQELNCEYRDKRTSGRLAPMQVFPLPKGSWSRFTRRRLEQLGATVEQYKHPCLIADLETSSAFLREFAGDGNGNGAGTLSTVT